MSEVLDRGKVVKLLESYVKKIVIDLPSGSTKTVNAIASESIGKLADDLIILAEPSLAVRWR